VATKRPVKGLLDTSVFIALESGRTLEREALPLESAISVVTSAELRAGILAADGIAERHRRIGTWAASRQFASLPITGAVADTWSQMRAYLHASGQKVRINDMWIAATAAAYEMPVLTQDVDFDAFHGVAGLTVIPV
jgi:predicted nucleic acid-binding protein